MSVLLTRALLFRVYIKAPEFLETLILEIPVVARSHLLKGGWGGKQVTSSMWG